MGCKYLWMLLQPFNLSARSMQTFGNLIFAPEVVRLVICATLGIAGEKHKFMVGSFNSILIHSPEWIVFRLRKNTLEIKLHLPVTWWVAEFGTDNSYAKASMDFKQTKIEILGNPRTTLYKQKWIVVIRLNLLEKFCRWWKLPIVKRDSYHSNLPLSSPFNLQEREKDEDLFHPSIHPLVAKQG